MYIKRQIEHKLTVSLWYNYIYNYFGSGNAKPNCMMIYFLIKNQQQLKAKITQRNYCNESTKIELLVYAQH